MSSAYPPQSHGYSGDYATNASVDHTASGAGDEIDKLIRMAEAGIKPPKKEEAPTSLAPIAQVPDAVQSTIETPDAAAQQAKPTEKKSKKETGRMVYSDPDVSPEERMAMMPRYAFVPDGNTEQASFEASSVAV